MANARNIASTPTMINHVIMANHSKFEGFVPFLAMFRASVGDQHKVLVGVRPGGDFSAATLRAQEALEEHGPHDSERIFATPPPPPPDVVVPHPRGRGC